MTLILTSDPTAVAGANLDTMVRGADPTLSLVPYAGMISASALSGTTLELTIHDPGKTGASNILRTNQGMATALKGAIEGRVGFSFRSLKFVDG